MSYVRVENLTLLICSLGANVYVHNLSHKHGKLGPKGNKCTFKRYPKHSKGYVFVGEHDDETTT